MTHRRPGVTASQYSITGIATEGGGEICREGQRKLKKENLARIERNKWMKGRIRRGTEL
jgi:hypothetical protein